MTEVNEVNIERGGAMAEGGGGGKGKLFKILLTVIVLGVVAGGGYYAWTLFFPGDKDPEEAAMRTGGAAGPGALPGGAPRLGSAGIQDNPTGYVKEPQYLELGNFIVNLSDGRRYLKVNIQIVLGNPDAKEYLEIRIADVKHVVLAKLQSLTSVQMKNPADRASLLIDLMNRIHTLFPADLDDMPGDDNKPIKKVLFTEFYLQ